MSTDKQTQVLKLALEALERVNTSPSLEDWHHAFDEEVTAIREALTEDSSGTEQPAQRTWIGVTDEEIEQVCVPLGAAMLSFTEVASAIEAKLKEKNGF